MKNKLLIVVMAVALVIMPTISFGQTSPDLGVASGFALFTAGGAFNNTGASIITGDVGTKVGAFAGFGTPVGSPGTLIGSIHVADPTSVQAGTDVLAAYGELSGTTDNFVLNTPLETQILIPGVYHSVGAAALNGEITLDAQNNPNAIFIIKINGALTVGAGSNVKLINSASLCNVYWQIYGGAFELGAGSIFRGTIIASGQIELLEGSSLYGRGLSTAGAILLHNNIVTISSAPNAAAGSDRAICLNESTQLGAAAVAGSTYSWTSVPAGFTSTVANSTVTPLVTTTYTVIETITATGCNSTNSVIVTVNLPPATSLIYHNL
jgi:hypothetical protein